MTQSPPDLFLKIHEVRGLLEISESTWRRGVKAGIYPKSYKVGIRAVRWSKAEVLDSLRNLPR